MPFWVWGEAADEAADEAEWAGGGELVQRESMAGGLPQGEMLKISDGMRLSSHAEIPRMSCRSSFRRVDQREILDPRLWISWILGQPGESSMEASFCSRLLSS